MSGTESDYLAAQRAVWGREELHDSRNPRVSAVVRTRLKGLLASRLGDGRLLDVGGYRGLQVAGLRAVVHDLSFHALGDALKRGLPVSCGDIHHLPYAASSFEGVLVSHVLEHSHRPEALLAELARVLKPGGFACVVVPNAAGLGQLIKLARHGDVKPSGNPPWEPAEHLHHFTRSNGERFLREQGWTIQHFEGDILDFPLRDKLRAHGFAGRLARYAGRWAESLVWILTR